LDLQNQAMIELRLKLAAQAWKLSRRQIEVLEWVVAGEPNKAIAKKLGCAIRTVEHHITRIRQASGTQTRTELVTKFWNLC